MTAAGQFVFGYGSLAADGGGRRARIVDHRRVWGVAMDNALRIAGYKYYRRRDDGSQPEVWVAFLDLVEEPRATTDGVLLAVDDAALRALDARERNYDRVDVSAHVLDAPGLVWAYRGNMGGRARLGIGLSLGTAVICRDYLEDVRAGFAALGIGPDPDPGALPVVDLERVDVAPRERA